MLLKRAVTGSPAAPSGEPVLRVMDDTSGTRPTKTLVGLLMVI